MNQLDLFSVSPAEPTQAQAAQERQSWEARQAPVARARANDPASSHDAAERMNRGAAKRHRERILDLVYAHPGCTSKELTRFLTQEDAEDGIDRVELGRRLPELEAADEIYRTSEGRQDMRCWPGERPK